GGLSAAVDRRRIPLREAPLGRVRMTATFLLDVDNTLLDNDGLKAWCDRRVGEIVGEREAQRFWDLYEWTRHDTGVVDYPIPSERFRGEVGPAVADQIERALVAAAVAE